MIGLECGLSSQEVLTGWRGERLVYSWLPQGSPGLGIGDALATFHSARKIACFRDKLKRAVTVGEMLSAVPRSI